MKSRRSKHQAGGARGSKDDERRCSSPAVNRSTKLLSIRRGMHRYQGGGCPLSIASIAKTTRRSALQVDLISSSPTSETFQFRKLPQKVPNYGSPESNAPEDNYMDKSATPGLLHSDFWSTKTAVRRFQEDFTEALGYDLGSVVELLQPDAFFIRADHGSYAIRAAIYEVFFGGFENESFDTRGGVCKFLDPEIRQAKFYEYYLSERDQQEPVVGDLQHEEFCADKYYSLWERLVKRSEPHQEDMTGTGYLQLASSFEAAIRSLWLLHKLAFSFEPPASIFRVEPGADVEQSYMELVVSLEDNKSFVPKVGFMIAPGLRLRKTVLRREVYLSSVTSLNQL